jgi:hypothetical protein
MANAARGLSFLTFSQDSGLRLLCCVTSDKLGFAQDMFSCRVPYVASIRTICHIQFWNA